MLTAFALALMLVGQEGQATLQSCVLEAEGWVCRYRVPDTILRPDDPNVADTAPPVVVITPSQTSASPPAASPPAPALAPAAAESESVREAARQARLIRRCADASWMALCTPGDRREAKALRENELAKQELARQVTGLAAAGDCGGAVRAALEGGDLTLARQMRDFCADASR